MTVTTVGTTRELASYLADVRFEDLPKEVITRTEELSSWTGSRQRSRAGTPGRSRHWRDSRRRWVRATGRAKFWLRAGVPLPLFAALVNGASSHVVEQDDVQNGSVFHPATVVFPRLPSRPRNRLGLQVGTS